MSTRGAPYGFEVFDHCLSCGWRTESHFCNLDSVSLQSLDDLTYTSVYPQGALLFGEGQTPRGVFLLCRGRVKMSVASSDGKTLITRVAESGEALGLSSAISGEPHRVTVETLEPSQVKFVKREDLIRFLQTNGAASFRANEQLSRECNQANDHVRSLGLSHSAAEKLAHLILSWCTDVGRTSDGTIRVKVLMTHQEISQMIGTSRETVTRLLAEFRDKKILSTRGSTLLVHNRAALEALVLL